MIDAALAAANTRRAFLRSSAAVTAGGLTLGACGGARRASSPGTDRPGAQSRDARLLNRSLDLVNETIAAYTAGIPLLSRRPREAAKRLLNQELSHAGELTGLVKQVHGTPSRVRPTYELGHPRRPREVLVLLHGLERQQVALMLDALPQLSSGSTRMAVGAVLGSDAQHAAVLAALLDLDPLAGSPAGA